MLFTKAFFYIYHLDLKESDYHEQWLQTYKSQKKFFEDKTSI